MAKREDSKPVFEALSAEQADTNRLVRQLFGTAIADRYVDFCALCSGRLPLKVSRPLAGHALRELDSSIRSVLAAPMGALPQEDKQQAKKREDALRTLREMKVDEETLQRVDNALKPKLNHRTQIERIVKQLGLAPDGDIAKLWIELTKATGRVHERSFHERLEADDAFRAEFARKFDTVLRAIITQLQDRYVALTRRAEEIARMRPAEGVKIFRREIPGAIPLQRHFYQHLNEDWLPFLEKEDLLGEPIPDDEMADLSRLRAWPAGQYLVHMASTGGEEIRKIVARVLRAVQSSTHPDVQQVGLEVVATLPAAEAAELIDVVEGWLTPESAPVSASPHALIKKFAEGGYVDAALRVTAALFQVTRRDGEAASFFDPTMYDYYLKEAASALEKPDPLQALSRFCDFLMEASRLDQRLSEVSEEDYSYYMVMSLEPSPTDGGDVLSAIIRAIVRFSEAAIERDPSNIRRVLEILGGYTPRMFRRIALHTLARAPDAAPDIAERSLTDKELIAADWCREEYGRLARAWFARLPAAWQREIFDYIQSSSEELVEAWHPHFEAYNKRKAGPDDDRAFIETSFRDIVWEWQDVLPPDRKVAFEKTVSEFGGRDAWKDRHFRQEPVTLTRSAMQQQPVDDTVAHLAEWSPAPDAQGRTVPGLAFELRESVAASPLVFSAGAAKFAGLRPVFIRHFLDGLRQPAANGVDLDWATCFKLLDAMLARLGDGAKEAHVPGDDTDWSWTMLSAIELLAVSLGRGESGMPFAHAERVRSLVLALYKAVKCMPGEDDKRLDRKHRYLAASQTRRGAAVNLGVLLLFWQSKDETSVIGKAPRQAIAASPDIRGVLEAELADHSTAGWIPRAVLGRYLNWLGYFGEDWLRERFDQLFPADNPDLAASAWLGHVEHDRPFGPFFELLRPYYVLHVESLGRADAPLGFGETAIRLTDYLMAHFLWAKLPDELLHLFLRSASVELRRHAMWFMGREMGAGREFRLRAMAYFEARLRSAIESDDPESFRRELGTISQLFRVGVDQIWLLDQLLKMLQAGFAPSDSFGIVDGLAKLLPEQVDRIVEVTNALVRQSKVDGWIFAAQDHALRQILTAGKKSDNPDTPAAVKDIVSYLASRGNTGFLDLYD